MYELTSRQLIRRLHLAGYGRRRGKQSVLYPMSSSRLRDLARLVEGGLRPRRRLVADLERFARRQQAWERLDHEPSARRPTSC